MKGSHDACEGALCDAVVIRPLTFEVQHLFHCWLHRNAAVGTETRSRWCRTGEIVFQTYRLQVFRMTQDSGQFSVMRLRRRHSFYRIGRDTSRSPRAGPRLQPPRSSTAAARPGSSSSRPKTISLWRHRLCQEYCCVDFAPYFQWTQTEVESGGRRAALKDDLIDVVVRIQIESETRTSSVFSSSPRMRSAALVRRFLTLLLPLGSIWPHYIFNVSKKSLTIFFASYFMTS